MHTAGDEATGDEVKYGSVCSGIEAATTAWHSLGWEPQWFAEIEKFPSEILAHHYPEVKNLGDFTKITAADGAIDVLVGGTPCQSFSVAGKRAGLDDPRGNLSLEFVRLLKRTKPKWFVWENVPGVLSIDKGRTFAEFLQAVEECGYGWAYRVLDAQYVRTHEYPRAVPQRRRRVFVVGYLGGAERAGAVLFESEGVCGNPPPSRSKGKVSPTIPASGVGPSRTGTERTDVTPPLAADTEQGDQEPVVFEARTFNSHGGNKRKDRPNGGFYVNEENITKPLDTSGSSPVTQQGGTLVAFSSKDNGADASNEVSPTVRAAGPNNSHANSGAPPAVVFEARYAVTAEDIARPLASHQTGSGFRGDLDHDSYVVTQNVVGIKGEDIGFALRADPSHSGDKGDGGVNTSMVVAFSSKDNGADASNEVSPQGCQMVSGLVRRLTPTECERLQGFPDNYTRIAWRGKAPEDCPDGPRYRAIGNSMAVNVMQWIGRRIQMVEEITDDN